MAALGTRTLTISIGGTEYNMQVSKSVITSKPADSDFVTFADAAGGGAREYGLDTTLVQDLAPGTLWDKIWTAAGTSAPVIVRPYGNTIPTETQPHYAGNVTITDPDGDLIGGEADASTTARNVVDASWVFAAKPVKITA